MNPKLIKSLSVFGVQLLIVSILLFVLHIYLYSHMNIDGVLVLPIWQIYLFHTIVVFIVYAWVMFKYIQGKKQEVFNYFMIGTILKMVLSIVFLLPVFFSDIESKRPDVINFFLPYFIFLAFEVFMITKLINEKKQ